MASRTRPVLVPPSDLNLYHRNARKGDVDAIAGSLRVNGQMAPIVVNIGTHTGRPNEVLSGNHTLKAFRTLGETYPSDERWSKVLVHWVDVDDDRAARFVLAANQTHERGDYDHGALLDLINSIDDLDGTGFTDEDLDELDRLANRDGGAPGSGDLLDPPAEDSYKHQYAVTVIVADEAEQEALFERLTAEGLECKVVTV